MEFLWATGRDLRVGRAGVEIEGEEDGEASEGIVKRKSRKKDMPVTPNEGVPDSQLVT